eukprot:2662336-Lingulodinium_polyedra.AAC.1
MPDIVRLVDQRRRRTLKGGSGGLKGSFLVRMLPPGPHHWDHLGLPVRPPCPVPWPRSLQNI